MMKLLIESWKDYIKEEKEELEESEISPDTPYGVVDKQTGKVVYKTTYKNRNKARRFRDKKDMEHGSYRYVAKILEEDY